MPVKHYTPEEDEILCRMWRDGKGPKEIGKAIGRSRWSVSNRAVLLELERGAGYSDELRQKFSEAGKRGGSAPRNYLTDREATILMQDDEIAALYAGRAYEDVRFCEQIAKRWARLPPLNISAPSSLVMACG